jgi:hypothetical protein
MLHLLLLSLCGTCYLLLYCIFHIMLVRFMAVSYVPLLLSYWVCCVGFVILDLLCALVISGLLCIFIAMSCLLVCQVCCVCLLPYCVFVACQCVICLLPCWYVRFTILGLLHLLPFVVFCCICYCVVFTVVVIWWFLCLLLCCICCIWGHFIGAAVAELAALELSWN